MEMMKHIDDPILSKGFQEIEAQFGIRIEEHAIERRGFTGSAEITIVVKFILLGIAAAIVKKLGEGLWDHLKLLTSRLRSAKRPGLTYSFVIDMRVGDESRHTSFKYESTNGDGQREVRDLEEFHTRLMAHLLAASSKDASPTDVKAHFAGEEGCGK